MTQPSVTTLEAATNAAPAKAAAASTRAFIEHLVPTGQGRVYAREYGGAEPAFVLMHGFPDNSQIYDELIPHLVAGGRRVVAFDFLGFGKSEKPKAAMYGFEQQLGDLRAVVDVLNIGSVVPVSHDSSGPAAINYALENPGRVASLCILNSAYAETAAVRWPELIELFATTSLKALTLAILQSPEQFAWLLNFQRRMFQDSLLENEKAHYSAFLGPVIDNNFRNQPSSGPAFAQMTAQLFPEVARNTTRLAEVEALDIPVQVIWGERDPYLNIRVAENFQSIFKNATLHRLAAGHWLQIDVPEQVARLMLTRA